MVKYYSDRQDTHARTRITRHANMTTVWIWPTRRLVRLLRRLRRRCGGGCGAPVVAVEQSEGDGKVGHVRARQPDEEEAQRHGEGAVVEDEAWEGADNAQGQRELRGARHHRAAADVHTQTEVVAGKRDQHTLHERVHKEPRRAGLLQDAAAHGSSPLGGHRGSQAPRGTVSGICRS